MRSLRGSAGARCARLLALATVLALAPAARAEPAGRRLPADATLTRLIEESLAAVPELSRAEDVVRAQAERVPQVSSLPDPMLQVGIQNDGFRSIQIGRMDTSYVSLMASQTFPWPGKRGLRGELAQLGAERARQSVARVRLSIEAEVRRAYLDLLLARDRMALLGQLEALWQKSLGVARVRYEAGAGAQSDVLRAQLELSRIKQRRFALQAEDLTRTQALNRLRNRPLDEPIETTTRIADLPALVTLDGQFAIERALVESPELAAARLGATGSSRAIALAEKDYYPDLTVGTGIMLRGDLPPMWLVTVAGPVPVFAGNRQSRSVAEGRASESAAQGEVNALDQLLRLRSRQRHTVFTALLQSIDLYERGLLIQSAATAESTLSQYTVGKVSFASVLEANAGYIADQEGHLQGIAAAHRILIAEVELSLDPSLPSAALSGAAGAMPGAGASPMEASSPMGGSSAGGPPEAGAPPPGGSSSGGAM
jgi:outer membrane protein, heavy metal efflux system